MQSKMLRAPEIKITFKPNTPLEDRPKVLNAQDAFNVLINHWDMDLMHLREESKMLCLANDSRVLGIFNLGAGGVTSCSIDPRIVFLIALKTPGTTGIILAHNHPSGGLRPSDNDLRITEKIQAGAKYFDLRLCDHIILSAKAFFSLDDTGILASL